jgi:hypothetical protein
MFFFFLCTYTKSKSRKAKEVLMARVGRSRQKVGKW